VVFIENKGALEVYEALSTDRNRKSGEINDICVEMLKYGE
jgi:hypothetical protein